MTNLGKMAGQRRRQRQAANGIVLLFATVFVTRAQATGLFAPIGLDSATVMPKGVRTFRLAGFTTEVDNKFDGYGSIVPLADSFNRPVTWAQLINSRPSATERGLLKGGLEAEGVSMGDVAGSSQGIVNARINSLVPVFAWGISENITLGVGLPIVYASTHVDTGWSVAPAAQEKINDLMTKGYKGKLLSFKSMLQNVVTTQIANDGYQPLQDESHTDIGDLNIGMKIKVYSSELVNVAIAPKLVAPTGPTPDVNKVVDVRPGDGRWNAGVAAIADFNLTHRLTLSTSASYLYQFVSDQAVRVPREADLVLSPDIDPDVQVKRGDIMGASLGTHYHFNDHLEAGVGYSFQYKNPDSYEGGMYTPDRYGFLQQDTYQVMQSTIVSFTASTVALYRAGIIPVPMDVTIAWSHVLSGSDVSLNDMAIFELGAYF